MTTNDELDLDAIERRRNLVVDGTKPWEVGFVVQMDVPALIAELRAARERLKHFETMTTMGVGRGDGRLFVHGDYDSIKAAQRLVFRAEAANRVEELVAKWRAFPGEVGPLGKCVDELEAVLRGPK